MKTFPSVLVVLFCFQGLVWSQSGPTPVPTPTPEPTPTPTPAATATPTPSSSGDNGGGAGGGVPSGGANNPSNLPAGQDQTNQLPATQQQAVSNITAEQNPTTVENSVASAISANPDSAATFVTAVLPTADTSEKATAIATGIMKGVADAPLPKVIAVVTAAMQSAKPEHATVVATALVSNAPADQKVAVAGAAMASTPAASQPAVIAAVMNALPSGMQGPALMAALNSPGADKAAIMSAAKAYAQSHPKSGLAKALAHMGQH